MWPDDGHMIGGQEGVDGSQIGPSRGRQPPKAANQALVGLLAANLGRGGIVGRGGSNRVDRET